MGARIRTVVCLCCPTWHPLRGAVDHGGGAKVLVGLLRLFQSLVQVAEHVALDLLDALDELSLVRDVGARGGKRWAGHHRPRWRRL